MMYTHTVDNAERFTRIRNGVNRGTQNHQPPSRDETFAQYQNRRNNNVQANRGLHETLDFYDDCYVRERNTSECFLKPVCERGSRNWMEESVVVSLRNTTRHHVLQF